MNEFLYKDKEWLKNQFVQLGKECHEIAKENGWTPRVVQKWCHEKYRINNHYRRDNYIPNKKQLQFIYGGVLGDGCISQRKDIDFTQYILTQNEEHKEYIYWIFDSFKNMCKHKDLKYFKSSFKKFKTPIGDKEYFCKGSYRMATRGYKFLNDIKNMSIYEIIDNIQELGLSIYFLDDGSKKNKFWSLCMGELSIDEVNYFIDKLQFFNIYVKRLYNHRIMNKEYIYLHFDVENSKKIDNIIIKNIPNSLDIMKKKVGL